MHRHSTPTREKLQAAKKVVDNQYNSCYSACTTTARERKGDEMNTGTTLIGAPISALQSSDRPYPVNIRPVLNGYVIDVGCQSVVFRHGDEELMATELAAYIRDPKGTQERYIGNPVELAYNPQ